MRSDGRMSTASVAIAGGMDGRASNPSPQAVVCGLHSENVSLTTTGNGSTVCPLGGSETAGNVIVPLIMFLSGLVGNILALVVLRRVRNRLESQRSVFYILVTGLTLTDLFSLVTISPVTLAVYSNNKKWVGGETLCQYDAVCMIGFGLATPLIICSMAIERFLALHCTFFYSRHINHRKAKGLLCAIWLTSLMFALLPMVGFGSYEIQFPGTWCFLNFHVEDHKGDILDVTYSLLFAVITLILIGITILCNMFVVGVLLKMRRIRISRYNIPQCRHFLQTVHQRELEIQMVWLLVCMTCAFLIFYGPLMVQIIVNELTALRDHRADLLAIYLACLNQIIDPWIYILLRKSLLQKAIRTYRRICCVNSERINLEKEVTRPQRKKNQMCYRYPPRADDISDSTGSARSCKILINQSELNKTAWRRYRIPVTASSKRKVKVWRFRKHFYSEPVRCSPYSYRACSSAASYAGPSVNDRDVFIDNQINCPRDSGIGILLDVENQYFRCRTSDDEDPFDSNFIYTTEARKRRRCSSFEVHRDRDKKSRERSQSMS